MISKCRSNHMSVPPGEHDKNGNPCTLNHLQNNSPLHSQCFLSNSNAALSLEALSQSIFNRRKFCPPTRGHLAMSKDTFWLSCWGKGLYWHLANQSQDTAKILQYTRQSSPPKIVRPKTSICKG